jgi:hypothetical protein
LHDIGQFTHTRRSNGASDSGSEPDGTLQTVTRDKIRHYCQIYLSRPDPIVFMTVITDTSGHICDDFSRLLFLHTHLEASVLTDELPETPLGNRINF